MGLTWQIIFYLQNLFITSLPYLFYVFISFGPVLLLVWYHSSDTTKASDDISQIKTTFDDVLGNEKAKSTLDSLSKALSNAHSTLKCDTQST
jgi:hypothetical protein